MEHGLFNHRRVQLVSAGKEKHGFVNLFFIAHCSTILTHTQCSNSVVSEDFHAEKKSSLKHSVVHQKYLE